MKGYLIRWQKKTEKISNMRRMTNLKLSNRWTKKKTVQTNDQKRKTVQTKIIQFLYFSVSYYLQRTLVATLVGNQQ